MNLKQLAHRAYLNIFRKYPLLALLGIISFLGEFGFGLLLATLPLFLVDTFGEVVRFAAGNLATVKLVTYSVATFAVTETVFHTIMGSLGDRKGRQPVAIWGAALAGCSPFLMYLLKSPLLFVPVRIIDGMGAAALWPSLNALAGEVTEERDRATAMSVLSTGRMVGLAFGPPTGLYLVSVTGSNRVPFLASVALFVLVSILCVVALPPRRVNAPAHQSEATRKPLQTLHEAVGLLRERPVLLVMVLTYIILQFGVTLPAPLIPVYAKHFLKFTEREMSLAFFVPVLTVGLISLPLSRISDRFGKLLAIRVSLAICTVGMCVVPFLRNLWPVMAIIGVLATAYAWGVPAWLGETSVLAPVDKQGLAMGIMNAARGVGFCLGPIVGGEAWARFGPTAPYFCSAALFALAAIAVCLLPGTKDC
ncbi:MAG: MFS transporter [Armatimonadetes bacterium]|nr:MFS transporter [Armatimonadota bacterium]